MDHAATEHAFAVALVDPALPVPPGLTTAHGAGEEARFAVYRNNVAVGLRKALSSRFQVVERLVGAAFFAVLARAYSAGKKPASPLIFAYGDDFPAFIAGFSPAATVPYLADVARIEAAVTTAFHAADRASLTVTDIAGIAPEDLPNVCLEPHPAAALVTSPHPAGSIWQANQGETVGAVAAWTGETVLVARPAFDVGVHILPMADAPFASALFAGARLGDAAQAAASEDAAFDFGTALVGLLGVGAFAGIGPAATGEARATKTQHEDSP